MLDMQEKLSEDLNRKRNLRSADSARYLERVRFGVESPTNVTRQTRMEASCSILIETT